MMDTLLTLLSAGSRPTAHNGAKLSVLRAIGEVTLNLSFNLTRQQQTGCALPFERALRGNRFVARFQASRYRLPAIVQASQ